MFTPTEQGIPGQTPIMDPLQLQFLTGGQMQYMPQAQFMTPSAYGAFRTMPTPEVTGPQTDGGLMHNMLVANHGSMLGGRLPEYTINTYNPAVSAVQQNVYANRRVSDSVTNIGATLASVGLSTGLGLLSLVPGLGLAGLALGMFAPDIAKPISERLRTTREIQDMSTAKIFSGSDVDRTLGYGFSDKAARNLDKFIRMEAADDREFEAGDYQEMLKLGMQYGQFDYANDVNQYKRILKNMRHSMDTMMEVMGSEDFEAIMKNMKRMRDMGATMEEFDRLARQEQTYARMTGLSYTEAVETYGKAGALTYSQNGLNAMQGNIQAMANAANMTYLQRTGVLDPITVAKFGGISGLTQEITAQDATVQKGFKDVVMPALMNKDLTGLRTDINLDAIMDNPTALRQIILESGSKIKNPDQMLAYMQHRDVAYSKLSNKYDMEKFELEMARQTGEMYGYRGKNAYQAGLVMMGMGPEEAALKYQAYMSDDAKSARRRAQEESEYKKRQELAAKYSWTGKLSRQFDRFFTQVGEKIFDTATGNRFNGSSNLSQQQKDDLGVADPGVVRGDQEKPIFEEAPFSGPTRSMSLPEGATMEDIMRLKNSDGLMTPEEARLYMATTPVTIEKETGIAEPLKSMDFVSPHNYAMGSYQITLKEFTGSYFKNPWLSKYKDKYFGNIDFKLLKEFAANGGKNPSGKVKEELAKLKEAWQTAAKDEEFVAASHSFSRYNIVHDRLNHPDLKQYGDRLDLLRNNFVPMVALESLANHGGIEEFKEVIRNVFDEKKGGLTKEQIEKSIAEDGGLSIAKFIYQQAYNQPKYKKDGKDRYNVDSKNSEYELLRQYAKGGKNFDATFIGAFSRHASNLLHDGVFKRMGKNGSGYSQTQYSKRQEGDYAYEGVRPDCSGFISAAFREFKHHSKKLKYKAEWDKKINVSGKRGPHEGTDADTLYATHVKLAGGKSDYSLTYNNINKDAKTMADNLKAGDVLYFQGTKNVDGKANKIFHTALVTAGEDGKLKMLDMRDSEKGAREVDLEQGLRELGHSKHGTITMHALGMGHVIEDTGNFIPAIPRGKYAPENKKNIDELLTGAKSDVTKLLDTLVDGQDDWVRYAYGSDAFKWRNILRLTDSEENEGDILNDLSYNISSFASKSITNTDLDLALAQKDENPFWKVWGDNPQELLKDLTDDWRVFTSYKLDPKHPDNDQKPWRRESVAKWREAVKRVLRVSQGKEPTDKEVDTFMQDDATMRSFVASVYKRFSKHADFKDRFAEMKVAADKAEAKVTSRGFNWANKDNANLIIQDTLAKALDIKESVTKNTASGEYTITPESETYDKGNLTGLWKDKYLLLREAYQAVGSKSDVIKNLGVREGEIYERIPALYRLHNEYLKARSDGKSGDEYKKKIEDFGKALKLDNKTIGDALSNATDTKDFIKRYLEKATGKELDNTSTDFLSKLSDFVDNEDKATATKHAQGLLQEDFSKVEATYSNPVLRRGQMRNAFSRLYEFLPEGDWKDIHDETKVSNVKFRQTLRMLRKDKFTNTAALLEKYRDNKQSVDEFELYKAVGKDKGIPETAFGDGQSRSTDFRLGQHGSGSLVIPPGGNAPGSSGAIFKPETETAFQQLPTALNELRDSVRRLNNALDKQKVPPAPANN